VDDAATRTRAIERQLKKVETLEEVTAPGTLHLIAAKDEEVINVCA
jgi:hypothetical protein